MKSIDLNVDLGEGGTDDAALLALATSANIACGAHAGSHDLMCRTIEMAITAGVSVGAHPGYEDRENFGRKEINLSFAKVIDSVAWQVEAFARAAGDEFHHVKPHGALYNQSNRDRSLADAVIAGVGKISSAVLIYAPPDGALALAARAAGMVVRSEGFADRRYRGDGSLVPRTEPGAVIGDVDEALVHAMKLAASGRFETLCVHGDGRQAAELLRAIRVALELAGFDFSPSPS